MARSYGLVVELKGGVWFERGEKFKTRKKVTTNTLLWGTHTHTEALLSFRRQQTITILLFYLKNKKKNSKQKKLLSPVCDTQKK